MVIYNRTLCTEGIKISCRHGNKYHPFCKSRRERNTVLKLSLKMLQEVTNLAKKGLY